jgi:hypothetical protein
MNAPLIIAGSLAIAGAAVHGVGGELLVMRKLSTQARSTRSMIHATWHLTTVAFLGVGVALVLAGSVLDGDQSRAIAVLGAAMSTAFAAVVLGLGVAASRSPRLLIAHPAPAVLTATAALAWWGAL